MVGRNLSRYLQAREAVDRNEGDLSSLRTRIRLRQRWDIYFVAVSWFAIFLVILLFFGLFLGLLVEGFERLSLDFLSSFPSRRAHRAGILSAWVGSLCVMIIVIAVSVPLGVASGTYLEVYARRNFFTSLIEINMANLAGVPSIVYGLLALGLFVYRFDLGQSILAAGLTLALLILPIVVVATREAIRSIPQTIYEATYGLGATRWQLVRDHVIPYATPGILTGVIIGVSRAIGETAPIITIGALTFIAFLPPPIVTDAFPFLSFEWLHSAFTVLPIQMFNWVSRPQAAFHINAAAAGVVLISLTLFLNALAIYIRSRLRAKLKW